MIVAPALPEARQATRMASEYRCEPAGLAGDGVGAAEPTCCRPLLAVAGVSLPRESLVFVVVLGVAGRRRDLVGLLRRLSRACSWRRAIVVPRGGNPGLHGGGVTRPVFRPRGNDVFGTRRHAGGSNAGLSPPRPLAYRVTRHIAHDGGEGDAVEAAEALLGAPQRRIDVVDFGLVAGNIVEHFE